MRLARGWLWTSFSNTKCMTVRSRSTDADKYWGVEDWSDLSDLVCSADGGGRQTHTLYTCTLFFSFFRRLNWSITRKKEDRLQHFWCLHVTNNWDWSGAKVGISIRNIARTPRTPEMVRNYSVFERNMNRTRNHAEEKCNNRPAWRNGAAKI